MASAEVAGFGSTIIVKPENSQVDQGSQVAGVIYQNLPKYVVSPPVEAVVFAWGVSEDLQLGLDTTENVGTPKVVEALLGTRFRGREFNRTPLVAGSRNTLAIDADGNVWSWGWNDRGTLGHGHRGKEVKPKRIQALRGAKVAQVALGGWHCLAVTQDGALYAWGGNEYQQCGVAPEQRDIVAPTRCLPELRVLQVACGGMHSLVLTQTGEVWTWGEPWGDFALNVQRSPRRVEGPQDIVSISCGAFHNMVLTAEGEVFSWGTNDYGQLGTGSTTYNTTPCKVVGLEDITISEIAAGGWHSVALSSSGAVFIWGRGEYGRLGIGDRTGSSKLRPNKVKGLEGHRIVQASAGGTHTMVLSAGGRMFIWGRGSYGRLGLGPEKDQYSPVELQLTGGFERWRVIAISAGGRHNMCLALPLREQSGDSDDGNASGLDGFSEPSHGFDALAEDHDPFGLHALHENGGSPHHGDVPGEFMGEDGQAEEEEEDEENQGTLAEERGLAISPTPFERNSLRNA